MQKSIQSNAVRFVFIILVVLITVEQHFVSTEQCVSTSDIIKSVKGLWTYKCMNRTCHKTRYHGAETNKAQTSLNVCKLKCGSPPGSLWPLPNGQVSINKKIVAINPNNINIESVSSDFQEMTWGVGKLFLELRKSFIGRIASEATRHSKAEGHGLHLSLQIRDTTVSKLTLGTDESYHLNVVTEPNKVKATITAPTYFGARHGTETLCQLIVHDDVTNTLVMPQDIDIHDSPVYKYRAFTLDTSRNFIPIADIRRTIEGMASVKMNMFHWHITDSHSFPLESKTFPNLTIYGAYGPDKIYKQTEIVDLVEFATWKGVRILPEFDAPAHAGEGWQWTPKGTLICFNEQPWIQNCVEPPCGQLNPINDNVYKILEGIQTDFHNLFDISDLFHMGGDEVQFKCWNQTNEIREYLESRSWDNTEPKSFLRIWDIFQSRAYSTLQQVTSKSPQAILWTSTLTEKDHIDEFLDKDQYIIQIWTTGEDETINGLAKKGYRMIFSNYDALYLDCGFGAWVTEGNNWCTPYKPWQKIYSNDMVEIIKTNTGSDYRPEMNDLILGASAALWTEQADEQSLDGRVWPRLAALAERLWTNPSTSWKEAEYRMLHMRDRLVKMGIKSEALEPHWCRQNEGNCPI